MPNTKNNRIIAFLTQILLFTLPWISISVFGQGLPPTTRELLSNLIVDGAQNKNLAILFNEGDDRTSDLIELLEDSDPAIRRNSQIVIRYLNSTAGMNSVFSSYKRNGVSIIGQVPIPLHDWDYDFIASTLIGKPENFGQISTEYLYALALDGSPRSTQFLLELIETAKSAKTDPFVIKSVIERRLRESFQAKPGSDLAMTVFKKSKMFSNSAKKHGSARIIAYNSNATKALIEIYVNYGVLADESYHVVVRKSGNGWSVSSFSQISGS